MFLMKVTGLARLKDGSVSGSALPSPVKEGWLNFNGLRLAVSLDGKRPLSAREQALQYELNQRKGGSFELDPQKPGATIDGQECVLVGFFKPRAATYPFVIRMLDSEKEYVIDTHTANRIFGSHPHLAHIGGADA